MSRHDSDREDLLREATALSERAEWEVAGWTEPVVAGFRSRGELSLYFGSDPVYQFNCARQLRRAFREGALYRSQGTTVARLVRTRTAEQTVLERTDLEPIDLQAFMEVATARLRQLLDALQSGQVEVRGQVPPDGDLRPKVIIALQEILTGSIRLSPAMPTKRV
jgi:hypothetical protein